jgi:hypothetical protein
LKEARLCAGLFRLPAKQGHPPAAADEAGLSRSLLHSWLHATLPTAARVFSGSGRSSTVTFATGGVGGGKKM